MTDQAHVPTASGTVELRIHGPNAAPVLVYLPGVHGDWTLLAGFRRAMGQNVRLVEVAYPRTLTWSLREYARAVLEALSQQGIYSGWLLGESFGSQVVWEMLEQGGFEAKGVILAGGFGRHPAPWMARTASKISGKASFVLFSAFLIAYAKVARWRFRNSPETLDSINLFIERRTIEDWRAWKHRFKLVAGNNPRQIAHAVSVPIYALTGLFDPIVPWLSALRWFKQHCPSLRAHRVVWRADHNVLGTAPKAAAAQILQWIWARPAKA